jgi:hypothetical protein
MLHLDSQIPSTITSSSFLPEPNGHTWFTMRLLRFLPLFATVYCVPVESTPQAKHPAIDVLNKFAEEVQLLGEEFGRWDGNPNAVERLLNIGRGAVATLHNATSLLNDSGDVDFLSSGLGLAGAGLSITFKTHSFASAATAKLALMKNVGADQAFYQVLDQAYTEATSFFTASKAKTPAFIFSLIGPFRNEILGVVADAREQYKPKQEVVVVVVPGKDGGNSLYTFTGGIPTAFPTAPPTANPTGYVPDAQYQYKPQPQTSYSSFSAYQSGSPYQPQLEYSPANSNPYDSQYTRSPPSQSAQYSQYIPGAPQYASLPSQVQFTQYTPTPTSKPAYAW